MPFTSVPHVAVRNGDRTVLPPLAGAHWWEKSNGVDTVDLTVGSWLKARGQITWICRNDGDHKIRVRATG